MFETGPKGPRWYADWAATMPGIPDDAAFSLVYTPATMATSASG